jgi:dihydropteroate synthase
VDHEEKMRVAHCELVLAQKNDETDRLRNAIEERANIRNENHALLRSRMLKLAKEDYDMCVAFVHTEEEKARMSVCFKQKLEDIIHGNSKKRVREEEKAEPKKRVREEAKNSLQTHQRAYDRQLREDCKNQR